MVDHWFDSWSNSSSTAVQTDFQQSRTDFGGFGLKFNQCSTTPSAIKVERLKNHGQTSVKLRLNRGWTQVRPKVRRSSKVEFFLSKMNLKEKKSESRTSVNLSSQGVRVVSNRITNGLICQSS
jgi:hypothetical protein